jgi:hypothetical protein
MTHQFLAICDNVHLVYKFIKHFMSFKADVASNNTSIKESVGELNQLMLMSTSSICSSLIGINEDVAAAAATTTTTVSHSNSTHNVAKDSNNNNNKLTNSIIKQRRTSSSSLSLNNNLSSIPAAASSVIQFKIPSNLPPVENGEMITMDLETYRLLVQDLQDTKIILHKLINILRDQPAMVLNPTENEQHESESAAEQHDQGGETFAHLISGLLQVIKI